MIQDSAKLSRSDPVSQCGNLRSGTADESTFRATATLRFTGNKQSGGNGYKPPSKAP